MISITRRGFLAGATGASITGVGCGSSRQTKAPEPEASSLIGRVEQSVIWRGRESRVTWFHPRACRVPSASGGKLLMAVQTISGSDVFGPVHWSESTDGAKSWSDPQPIPGLGRKTHPDGIEEGVCDTVPQHHPPTDSVIFTGWNVYYKDGKLTQPEDQRWPVYVVRKSDGSWTPPRKLEWNDPEATRIYGSNCSQRLTLPNGDVLIPMTYAPVGQPDRGVGTVLCSFDGETLAPKDRGNTLRLSVKRGLVEPSIVEFGGR